MFKILLSLPLVVFASAAVAEGRPTPETAFAKSAFVALHSLPRPANDIDASLSYFASADAFAEFVRTSRATPFTGVASVADISVTYDFVEGTDAFSVGKGMPDGSVAVMFNVVQHVKASGREADNCFAVSAIVRSEPLGIRGLATGFSLEGMETRPIPLADCQAK